ncbi:MAG: cytidylate kinase-like family protein [Clostridia bacterium]|nr:cytidylate kinase-like family protein [Clostridia bacterium]
MENNRIIVISREYGSAGSLIGRLLAEQLGIPYYDKNFINEAVKNSGLSVDFMEREDQKFISSLLFNLATGGYRHANNKDMSDQVYIAESNAIKQVAQQGPCVIVGRCADYILRDEHELFSVFIHADFGWRVKRCIEQYGSDAKRIEQQIREKDRKRARHYEYYTDCVWGDRKNYHMSINSSLFGIEKSVELIRYAYEQLGQ